MRRAVAVLLGGVVLIVVGLAFAYRSWGWSLTISVVGALMVIPAAVRVARIRQLPDVRRSRGMSR